MIEVAKVKYAGGYRLSLVFSDETHGVVDLTAEVMKRRRFGPLRDEKVFAQARIDGGTVAWPGGIDLAPERLYALAHELPQPQSFEDARRNELQVSMRELRALAGVTQSDLAERLDKSQAELSRFERRDDVKIGNLRAYVEALGGQLHMVVTLAGKRVVMKMD